MTDMQNLFALTTCCVFAVALTARGDESVFSGPQANEVLPPCMVKGVFGDHAGKDFDFIQSAKDAPVFLVFVHSRTRPAFGLTNAMLKYAIQRESDGLKSGVFFLTADATETEKWMNAAKRNLPAGGEWGISPDGQEGPGAYGLNRNVTLTILVGKGGKVTENFALVQPSLQVDGPKILKAIVAAVGSGEVPELSTLTGPAYRGQQDQRMQSADDPNLIPLIRAVINKQATAAAVDAAAIKVEEYVEQHELARKHLSRVTNTVVNSDRLDTYGTPAAREYLKKWAKKYPAPAAAPSTDKAE